MITPRVPAIARGRADFDELEQVFHEHGVHWSDDLQVTVQVWRSPEDQMVLAVYAGHRFSLDDVERVALELNALLVPRAHVFLYGAGYADSFDEALDAAVQHDITLTLMEQEPIHPEVAAVPNPDPAPAVTVTLTISERDFDLFSQQSFRFSHDPERWVGFLEPLEEDKEEIDGHWEIAYVIDRDFGYANVKLAAAFLDGQGAAYEVASDPNDGDWLILTNFKTRTWRRSEEIDRVKARLEREKAEQSGDELLQAYLAPSAEKDDEEQPGEPDGGS